MNKWNRQLNIFKLNYSQIENVHKKPNLYLTIATSRYYKIHIPNSITEQCIL